MPTSKHLIKKFTLYSLQGFWLWIWRDWVTRQIKIFWQLSLNRHLFWVFNFQNEPRLSSRYSHFPLVKVKTYGRNNKYWRCLQQFTLRYYFLVHTPIDFYEQVNHIRGPQTNFTVFPRPSNDDISSEEHFEIWKPGEILMHYWSCSFFGYG